MGSLNHILELAANHWDEMRAHVVSLVPEEACGLVAGAGNQTRGVYPITNTQHSPTRFAMDPAEQVRAMLQIATQDWLLLAIYHSHPAGPAFPSVVDLDQHAYPGSFSLIWSPVGGSWMCKGYLLDGCSYDPIRIIIKK